MSDSHFAVSLQKLKSKHNSYFNVSPQNWCNYTFRSSHLR